jgi:DNA modification methylase
VTKTARKKQNGKDIARPRPASAVWKNRIVGYGEEPPDQLLANEKNWRIHPKTQQEALKGALSKVGIVQNVIVNRRSGKMIDGHLRVQMAISENQPTVPITYVDLSDEEEALVLATIDPVTGLAGTDQELLDSLITDIRLSDLGMDLGTGLNDLLNSLSPDPSLAAVEGEDDVPELPSEPVSRMGDLWLLGDHRLLCGDCTDSATVSRLLQSSQPLIMITDPPYGIELDSEWRDRAGLNGHGPAEASYMKHRTEGHTNTSISSDTRADWSEAFALVGSLEVAYVWHASKFTREVLDGLLRIGFLHHQQIIWNKGRTVLTRTHYWFQHEPCWYVRKKNAPWFGKPGENSTIWDSPSPKFIMGSSNEEKFDHPTQKPVELMRRPILNHTKRADVVYDPFLGSGTTLAAAEVTGRICYGIEIDPRYVDVICQRWMALTKKQATLDGDGRTFAEVQAERGEVPV